MLEDFMAAYLPPEQLLLILGMAVVTYIPRAVPLLLLSSKELNPLLMRWLEMVPPAVLSALLAQDLFLRKSAEGAPSLFVGLDNIFLLAAVPTFFIGWLTRSFFGTVLTGMGLVALMRFLQRGGIL